MIIWDEWGNKFCDIQNPNYPASICKVQKHLQNIEYLKKNTLWIYL